MDNSKLAQKIKDRAKEQNLPLKKLLFDCNLNVNFISQIRNGTSISLANIEKIADKLNISIDSLLDRKIDAQKNNPDMKTNHSILTEQEQTIIKIFREASEEDRLEMIASIINIKNNR